MRRQKSYSPIPIHIIIKRQLFILLHIPLRKDPHPYFRADGPFRDVAVGVAGVVREAADPAAFGGVDELQVASVGENEDEWERV